MSPVARNRAKSLRLQIKNINTSRQYIKWVILIINVLMYDKQLKVHTN